MGLEILSIPMGLNHVPQEREKMDFVSTMLVQSNGKNEIKGESKKNGDAGNLKFSANSDDIGEILDDQREEFECGNDVEVDGN